MEELTPAAAVTADVIKDLAKDAASYVTKKVAHFVDDTVKKESVDTGWAFEKYIEKVYDTYSRSKSIIHMNEAVELSKFFIPMFLMWEKHTEKKSIHLNNTGSPYIEKSTSRYVIAGDELKNVFERNNKIIITGIGGMGKTMHMKHYCVNAIERRYKIPVFIEFRWFNDREIAKKSFEQLIYERLIEFGFQLPYEYFIYSLDSGKYVFLLDGFDEVSRKKRSQISVSLQRFTEHYSQNSFIISSRQIDDIYGWNEFTVYYLCRMSYTQAVHLIGNLDYNEEFKNKFINALTQKMFDKYESFLSVPLLLSIFFITFVNGTVLPDTLQEFYDMAFNTMMYRHDNLKTGNEREFESTLSFAEFKEVFMQFCLNTYINDKYTFSETSLIDNIRIVKKEIGIGFDEYAYKNDLVNICCMLIRDGLDYSFIHPSFQEFFAARCVSEGLEEDQKSFCSALIQFEDNRNDGLSAKGTIEPVNNKLMSFFQMLDSINHKRFEHVVIKPILEKIYTAFKENGEDIANVVAQFFHVSIKKDGDSITFYICFKNDPENKNSSRFNAEEFNVLCNYYSESLLNIQYQVYLEEIDSVMNNPDNLNVDDRIDFDDSKPIRTVKSTADDDPDDLFLGIVTDLHYYFRIAVMKYNNLKKQNERKPIFKSPFRSVL